MRIYGLLLYVCNSRQDPNGASTFTESLLLTCFVDSFCGECPSLPRLTNTGYSSKASLQFCSLKAEHLPWPPFYSLPQLNLCALEHTQLIQISEHPP